MVVLRGVIEFLFEHIQMKKKFIAALSLILFALNCAAIDTQTGSFIGEKVDKFASQGKYDEALAEIVWLLRDDSPTIRRYAEGVLSKYPAVANARINALTMNRLAELGCEEGDILKAKQAALTLIDEVARFADSQKVEDARARVDLVYENRDIADRTLKCKQAQEALQVEEQKKQVELADAATKRAPAELRALDFSDFCVQYGLTLRGNPPEAYSMVRNLPHLFEAEAKRRRASIEKNLVKSERIRIGINQCTLYASWGYTDSQNRTVGPWGIHIQHVYGDLGTYVYTENGRVTSWQD